MKKLFKFSGIVTPKDRVSNWEFEGYFVKQTGNNDIFGVNRDIVGNAFIKGLFIENQSLIFVEISEEMRKVRGIKYHQRRGYAFNDINRIGEYSKDDIDGIFAWNDGDAVIQLTEVTDQVQIANIEKQHKEFYEKLDDYDKFFFNNSQKLTDFL